MKKILPFLLIATLISCNYSSDKQNNESKAKKYHKVLDTFDFEKNNYLVFLINSTQYADVVKDTGHYFLNDKEILKQLQKEWVLERETNHIDRLMPDYQLCFINNDSLITYITISKEKNILVLNDSINYKFPYNKFLQKYLNTKNKLYAHNYEFRSIKQWHDFKNSLDLNKIFINDMYIWGHYRSSSIVFKYSHFFRFKYEIPYKEGREYFRNNLYHFVKPIIKRKINEKYRNEKYYYMSIYGKHDDKSKEIYHEIDLFCNEDLYKKFNLYKRIANFQKNPIKLSFFSKDSVIYKNEQ